MEETPPVILRRLRASPRAVWRVLTTPDELERWMAPDTGDALVASEDRGSGHYQVTLKYAGGEAGATFEIAPAGDGTELLVRLETSRDERTWKARVRRLARHVETR